MIKELEATEKVEKKHDFATKLRQPSLWPAVQKYIEWQKTRRGNGKTGVPSWLMPFSINLDLTTACNYRCDHCIDLAVLNSKVKHDYEILTASLENMIAGGLRSVILIGGGESTLHPKFSDTVRFLKGHGLQVAVVSNGSRNDVILGVADAFDERDWVRFSLDAGTTDTFLKMHKPVKPITLEEICSWVPKIRERNPRLPIGFSFIVTWAGASSGEGTKIVPNIHEMVRATELAKESRFSYISFKPFLTRYPDGEEVLDPSVIADFDDAMRVIQAAVETAKTYESPDFRVIESTNMRALMDGSWRNFTKQPHTCHMQAFHQVLSPIGLFNCPSYRGVEKARISDKNAYGSPEAMRETREHVAGIIDRFDASHECQHITCLFNSANWMIEKAITGELGDEELQETVERGDYYF